MWWVAHKCIVDISCKPCCHCQQELLDVCWERSRCLFYRVRAWSAFLFGIFCEQTFWILLVIVKVRTSDDESLFPGGLTFLFPSTIPPCFLLYVCWSTYGAESFEDYMWQFMSSEVRYYKDLRETIVQKYGDSSCQDSFIHWCKLFSTSCL